MAAPIHVLTNSVGSVSLVQLSPSLLLPTLSGFFLFLSRTKALHIKASWAFVHTNFTALKSCSLTSSPPITYHLKFKVNLISSRKSSLTNQTRSGLLSNTLRTIETSLYGTLITAIVKDLLAVIFIMPITSTKLPALQGQELYHMLFTAISLTQWQALNTHL